MQCLNTEVFFCTLIGSKIDQMRVSIFSHTSQKKIAGATFKTDLQCGEPIKMPDYSQIKLGNL